MLFPPRYQVGLDRPVTQTYKDLLTKLPGGSTVIEKTTSCVDAYVKEWLDYQSLWVLLPDALVIKFGEDISKWMRLLSNIKKSRATFDTSETKKEFAPVVIDYAKAQSKVSLKYDSWQKDALGKFGSLLGTEMANFYGNIGKARSELEQQTIDAASTSDVVSFITYVQGLKRKMRGWEKQVDVYREGQRIFERQRFQFPGQWLGMDNIDGEWGTYNAIMRRKDSSIQNQVNSLQVKLIKMERINQIKAEMAESGENFQENNIAEKLPEQEILIQSVCETMEPKLVAEDIPLLFSLLNDVFPGVEYQRSRMDSLKAEVVKICAEDQLLCGVDGEEGLAWMEKVIQLYQITNLHHGLMMVGPSGSGKSTAWKVLLKALERLEGVEGVAHVIDPKALSKEDLYGVLDPNTREWTDGLFTHILRFVI